MSAALPELELPRDVEVFFNTETLKSLDFQEGLVKNSEIKQTSMTEEAAKAKLQFLINNKFDIPTDWYVEIEGISPTPDKKIKPIALACIHVLYSLAARVGKLRELQFKIENMDINDEDANKILMTINYWLHNRIEKDNTYRQAITDKGQHTNIEHFWRDGENGMIVNPDQKISQEEMFKVVAIFKDRFAKK